MAVTFKDLIRQVKGQIREVGVEEARARGDAGGLVVDVREADEWEKGHVPGAIHIPRGFLELRIEEKAPERSAPVTLYCAGGTRSALGGPDAARPGLHRRRVAGRRVRAAGRSPACRSRCLATFTAEQRERYSRHLRIPEVGEAGQARLLDAKVLLIGAGGLGSPAGLYLAAAGVGTLGIADFDVVDLSNLQRQVLHRQDTRRPAQDGVRGGDHHRPQPRRARGPARRPPGRAQRHRRDRRVRRDPRRLGQLLDQVPGQRRRGARRQAARLRQHLPLRRAGLRVPAAAGARATAASTPSPPRRSSRLRATRRASSACCPA